MAFPWKNRFGYLWKNPLFGPPWKKLRTPMLLSSSDVVETVTFETETWLKLRDRDFIKNPETETWPSRPSLETSKFIDFAEIFFKCRHHFQVDFFQISVIFPSCFGCFLSANTINKKSLNCRNFTKSFLRNIQSLEACSLRLVSRPIPSLQTPPLLSTTEISQCTKDQELKFNKNWRKKFCKK